MDSVYCWGVPDKDESVLKPIVRVWLNRPGLSAKQAAHEAIERIGYIPSSYAIMDQPPGGGDPSHTYNDEFTPLYNATKKLTGADLLRDWWWDVCDELKSIGLPKPEFISADWEGYAFPVDFSDWKIVQRGWITRESTLRYCIFDPVWDTWGYVDGSNYQARPKITELDKNGKPFPPFAVSHICSGSFYSWDWGDEFNATIKFLQHAGNCQDAGLECVPWLADRLPLKMAQLMALNRLIWFGKLDIARNALS